MIYRFGDIAIDEDRDEIRRDGEVVPAQKKVRDLLLYLIHRRDRLVPKEELFEALWPGVTVNEAALTQAVYGARRAVGDDARNPWVLKTIRGRGVRFVATIETQALASGTKRESKSPSPEIQGTPSFVGRDELVADLDSALRATSRGKGDVVLLSGEPGIGKSRVAEEFAARARSQDAEVHIGRCPESPGAPAFWPWVQLFRSYLQTCGREEFETLLGSDLRRVAKVAPEFAPLSEQMRSDGGFDAEMDRFAVFDAVCRVWKRRATGRTVVLVLDDLHRADLPSWRLLQFVAAELDTSPILVLGTYRDTEISWTSESKEMLAKLVREPRVRSIRLAPLGRSAIREILRESLGAEPHKTTVTELTHRSSGNAFFVTHLAALLSKVADSRSVLHGSSLPPTLREGILRQLQGISGKAQHALAAASVVGRAFDLSVLKNAVSLDRESTLEVLDECASAGLVRRRDSDATHFEFCHILVRDALYENLSGAERANLHASVATILENRSTQEPDQHLDALSYHLSQAVALEGPDRALKYAKRAGHIARSRLAFEDAAWHFSHSLRLLEQSEFSDDLLRCEILLGLGESQARAGKRQAARRNLSDAASLAERLHSGQELAKVALATAPGFFSIESGVYDEFSVALLESALRLLPKDAHYLKAMTGARLAVALYWSDTNSTRRILVEQAQEDADESGSPTAIAHALVARYAALWGPDNLADRVRLGGPLLRGADRSSDASLRLIARVFEITTLLERGAFSKYYAAVNEFAEAARTSEDRHGEWYAALFQANIALMRGQLSQCIKNVNRFHRIGNRLGDANAEQAFSGYVATVALARSKTAGLASSARDQASRYPRMVCWKCAEAFFLALTGKGDASDRLLSELMSDGLSSIPRDMNYLMSTGLLAFAVGLRRDKQKAEELVSALEPFSDRQIVVGYASLYWGAVARAVAVLAGVLNRGREEQKFSEMAYELESEGGVELPWKHLLVRGV